MITQRFEFARMRELVVASDDSNSFEYGRERSHGRFEFVRMREGEIAREIRVLSNAKRGDRAGYSNSLERERGRSCAMILIHLGEGACSCER